MSSQKGTLIGIAIRSRSRAEMQELERLPVTTHDGLFGDFRGKPGARQVTVLAIEDWESACRDLGKELPWTIRRANLLVEGLKLLDATDSVINIGDVVLEVTGETDPCSRMDESEPGLQDALVPDWRGGVCCRVKRNGELVVGAPVTMLTAGSRQ